MRRSEWCRVLTEQRKRFAVEGRRSGIFDCAVLEFPAGAGESILPAPHCAFNLCKETMGYRLLDCRFDPNPGLRCSDDEAGNIQFSNLSRYVWLAGERTQRVPKFQELTREAGRLLPMVTASKREDSLDGDMHQAQLRWIYFLCRLATQGELKPYSSGKRLWVKIPELGSEYFSPPPSSKRIRWWSFNRYDFGMIRAPHGSPAPSNPYQYSHRSERLAPQLAIYTVPHEAEAVKWHARKRKENDAAEDSERLPSMDLVDPNSISDLEAREILKRHFYVEVLDVFSASVTATHWLESQLAKSNQPSPAERDAASSRLARTAAHAPQVEAYVFRKVGDTWDVAFEGEHEEGLKQYSGMDHIKVLLGRPNPTRAVPAETFQQLSRGTREEKLSAEDRSTVIGGVSRQETLDPQAREEYRRRLAEIGEQIQTAIGMSDSAQQEKLELEKQGIVDELKASKNKFGAQRNLGRTPAERSTQAVEIAIRRVRAHLREKGLHKLADHLENSIKREGTGFAYRPGPDPPTWALQS